MIFLTLGVLLLTAVVLFSGYKMFVEPYQLMISEKEICYGNLPEGLDGLRIVHLSDFHFDENNGGHIISFFDHLLERRIDFIILTGDFIESLAGLHHLKEVVKRMLELKPKYGIYGCLGNHDYYHFSRKDFILVRFVVDERNDVKKLLETLEDEGVKVLMNENVVLDVNGAKLNIVGIDEYVSGRFNLPASIDGVDPDGFTILISHAPDIVFHLEPYKVDLVLSGHTHGGQIKLPFWGTVIKRTKLKRKQSSGFFKYNGTNVHVTQGLGASPKAMVRFLCSPEVAILTLKKTKETSEQASFN